MSNATDVYLEAQVASALNDAIDHGPLTSWTWVEARRLISALDDRDIELRAR